MAIRYDVEQKCVNPLTLLVTKAEYTSAIPCTDRDMERLDRLVRANRALLEKLCRAQFSRIEDAEDLAANTLLAICKRFNTFDPEKGKFGTWLGTIVRNEAVDMRRRAETQPKCVPNDPVTEFLLESIEAKVYERKEEPEVISDLPPLLRKVMNLTKVDGMTSAEAAKVLHTTEGTIRTYIWRARQLLRGATII